MQGLHLLGEPTPGQAQPPPLGTRGTLTWGQGRGEGQSPSPVRLPTSSPAQSPPHHRALSPQGPHGQISIQVVGGGQAAASSCSKRRTETAGGGACGIHEQFPEPGRVATHKPDREAHMRGLGASHQGDSNSVGQGLPCSPASHPSSACRCSMASDPTLGMQTSPGLCPSFLYQELSTKQGAAVQGAWKREPQGPSRVTPPVLGQAHAVDLPRGQRVR